MKLIKLIKKQYLSHVYAEKTSSFNQLVKSLLEFYKSELTYLDQSLRSMSTMNEDESYIEQLLKKFNADQSSETKIMSELNARCRHHNQQQQQSKSNNYEENRNSTKHIVKSCENLYVGTGGGFHQTPAASASSTSCSATASSNNRFKSSDVVKRSAERSALFKSGYLLKKPQHQGVRNWLRRKCVAENGYLYIFHAEVDRLFVI